MDVLSLTKSRSARWNLILQTFLTGCLVSDSVVTLMNPRIYVPGDQGETTVGPGLDVAVLDVRLTDPTLTERLLAAAPTVGMAFLVTVVLLLLLLGLGLTRNFPELAEKAAEENLEDNTGPRRGVIALMATLTLLVVGSWVASFIYFYTGPHQAAPHFLGNLSLIGLVVYVTGRLFNTDDHRRALELELKGTL
ncbi:hypothetical protein [Streptomyces nanshensis]|uniref:Uncharacterized protein n=1 Tax=Streptomyces nanshensis TaxID=518642 RepID=A0A1E7KZA7_9ACTN|nr:hypothetical protein [Streptomyces nanshensis]OEV09211.1 hypothetical protein AN218_22305 [Streptomyces nanshensis]